MPHQPPSQSDMDAALQEAEQRAALPLPGGRAALKARAISFKKPAAAQAAAQAAAKPSAKPAGHVTDSMPKIRYGGGQEKAYLQIQDMGKWLSVMNITKQAVEASKPCRSKKIDHKIFARHLLDHAIRKRIWDREGLHKIKEKWLLEGVPKHEETEDFEEEKPDGFAVLTDDEDAD